MAHPSSSTSKKILIIEDEIDVAEVIKDQLNDAGYEGVCAVSTRMATLEISKGPIAAVILDLQLEGENGIDFLPYLKKTIPSVPVMILTGRGYESEVIETALQNGATAYFSKESGIENVPHMIERLLNPKPLA